MIGDVAPRYSTRRYDAPSPVEVGRRVERGCPKSLFRPGSSTVVLVFQKGRIRFEADLVANLHRADAHSLFSAAWGGPWAETDVAVRSPLARVVRGGGR